MKKYILLLILLSSCTAGRERSIPEIVQENEVTNNRVLGISKEDVAKMYGLPYMAMKLDGKDYWSHRRYGSCIITIVFDKNDKVVKAYKNAFCPFL